MSTVAGVVSKCAYAEQCCRDILHLDRGARSVNARLAVRVHYVIVYSGQTTTEGPASSFDFYRAMLCIARTMPSQGVCLSVRLPVTRRYSVERVTHILIYLKLFYHRVATLF